MWKIRTGTAVCAQYDPIAWRNLKELYRHKFQFKIKNDDTRKAEKREGLALQPPFLFCGTRRPLENVNTDIFGVISVL